MKTSSLILAPLLFGAALLLAIGCKPPPVTPSSLIGGSESQVTQHLGPPMQREELVLHEPAFGPRPVGLPAGSAFTMLVYERGDKVWYVMLVTPALYQQKHGKSPGGEALYVVDVATFPKGAVF